MCRSPSLPFVHLPKLLVVFALQPMTSLSFPVRIPPYSQTAPSSLPCLIVLNPLLGCLLRPGISRFQPYQPDPGSLHPSIVNPISRDPLETLKLEPECGALQVVHSIGPIHSNPTTNSRQQALHLIPRFKGTTSTRRGLTPRTQRILGSTVHTASIVREAPNTYHAPSIQGISLNASFAGGCYPSKALHYMGRPIT